MKKCDNIFELRLHPIQKNLWHKLWNVGQVRRIWNWTHPEVILFKFKKIVSCSILTFNESCYKIATFSLNSRKILLTLSKRIVEMLPVIKIFNARWIENFPSKIHLSRKVKRNSNISKKTLFALISSKFHANWQQFEYSVECPASYHKKMWKYDNSILKPYI